MDEVKAKEKNKKVPPRLQDMIASNEMKDGQKNEGKLVCPQTRGERRKNNSVCL
jgi:hypothetical protein